jgi:hypothetical protein
MFYMIKTLNELRELAREGCEIAIHLNGGGTSTKFVKFSTCGRWLVENYIDGTIQRLSDDQIVDPQFSCIGKALELNCLSLDK